MPTKTPYRIEIYEIDRGVEFARDFHDEAQLRRAAAILDDITGNRAPILVGHPTPRTYALTSAQWTEFGRRFE